MSHNNNNILKTPYEKSRNYITTILNNHCLNGIGVEIGVKKGHFSKVLLDNWKCKKLYLIDPWCNQDATTYDETHHNHSQDYEDCKTLLNEYSDKFEMIRKFSHEAHQYFENESLDFIYIDGNHSYENVKQDLELWYPKLVKHGIICGDDYTTIPQEDVFGYSFGVKKAVDEFALLHKKNVSIDLTGEWYYRVDNNNIYPSRNWYFIK